MDWGPANTKTTGRSWHNRSERFHMLLPHRLESLHAVEKNAPKLATWTQCICVSLLKSPTRLGAKENASDFLSERTSTRTGENCRLRGDDSKPFKWTSSKKRFQMFFLLLFIWLVERRNHFWWLHQTNIRAVEILESSYFQKFRYEHRCVGLSVLGVTHPDRLSHLSVYL